MPLVGASSILTLTPLVFRRLSTLAAPGSVSIPENGPLIPLFGVTVGGLILGAVYLFLKGVRRGDARETRSVWLIMIGTGITFALLILFNFILPTQLNTFTFIPYGAIFILPFIGCTGYAIARYHLFNAKVIAAEMFAFFLTISTLLQVVFSTSLMEVIFRASAFLLVLAVSVLLVRSVMMEVKQRELIEIQEKELEQANKGQESLLHFISHEIKGYLTKGEAAFSEILEGDLGSIPQAVKTMSEGALGEMRKGVATVMDILDASNLKKGTVAFKKELFDFKTAMLAVIEELKSAADEKNIAIRTHITPVDYRMTGDEQKLREHVIRNLIDNAIRYTPKGEIAVDLYRTDHKLRFAVADNGVGITQEDMANLFTEGGHGKNSIKVNVHSTGYGLYIVKRVVEAHGGKVWAESEGEDKGSKFVVELPVV